MQSRDIFVTKTGEGRQNFENTKLYIKIHPFCTLKVFVWSTKVRIVYDGIKRSTLIIATEIFDYT